ncbi:M28 family metallopeptidase [Ideonella sp.]|uniref:M28 family metallopeptidase n=1 Tax=Ideonella sp. TaxID=1929293 RepID=UPI0039C8B754
MMKKLHRAALVSSTLATCFVASAQAGPMVWASMGEDAYRLLRRAGAQLEQVEPHSVAIQAPAADGRVGTRNESVYLMQVDEEALPRLSHEVHENLKKCGGFMLHTSRAEGRKVVAQFRDAAAKQANQPAGVSYGIDDQAEVNALMPQLQESNIRSTIVKLSTEYKNRYYTTTGGVGSSNDLLTTWKQLAAGRDDVTVKQFTHPSWPQKSVILTIKGTTNPGKIVVIGGHLDSTIGWTNENSIAPGADDDASGIATLQEVMRVLLSSNYKPRRTLQFMAYAAEEVGLKGSQGIAADYQSKGKKVVGVLQLDMTNYQGAASDITMITDYTNSAQNKFLKDLAAHYMPSYNVNESRCGYACSDHASWTNRGFVASFPFEAPMGDDNPYIHTPNDTISKSGNNANHALKFAKLALAYAVELGSDGPAPKADTK